MAIWRVSTPHGERLARGPVDSGPAELLPASTTLDSLLAAGSLEAEGAGPAPGSSIVLAPVQGQEVWAAGVTYESSRVARNEESGGHDFYDKVYDAERPELFFKAAPGRVRDPGGLIGVRRDSGWDVPEPELALVCSAAGKIVGYTIGNDVSSRSIEGENTLYLPQAKTYDGSCAIGPAIVPATQIEPPFTIRMTIERDGIGVYDATTSTGEMRRSLSELAAYLGRALSFPVGAFLMTGTGIVPDPPFTLEAADVVTIAVDGLGALTNTVTRLEIPA
jgi:2-dehydro-3-deoxy-D-arabinonate dehydratase